MNTRNYLEDHNKGEILMIKQTPQLTNEIVQNLFHDQFPDTEVKFGFVTVPVGERLPKEGTNAHEEQEYSYVLRGTLLGESGGEPYSISAGEASFIPAGEQHWCANEGNEPVELVFALVRA